MIVTAPDSDVEYSRYFDLRWRVLRAPWQQPRGSERDELEGDAVHRMIVNQNRHVVAVGRLHQTEPGVGQIRYMAVEPEYQGQGLGKMLLITLESAAPQQEMHTLFLHAREPVVGFYQQQGYRLIEASYILFGTVPHYYMQKQL